MKKNKLMVIFTILIMASMVLAACGGANNAANNEVVNNEVANNEVANNAANNNADMDEEEMDMDMEEFVAASVVGGCEYGGIIDSIVAVDQYTVEFTLCQSDPAFLSKAAFTPFGIQPSEYLAAEAGTGMLLEAPIGTGPYMVTAWNRGESVVYERFDGYYGDAPAAQTVILRWNQEGAARLLELQSGNVDMITAISPDDFSTVADDPNLVLLPNPSPNILYVGFTNTFAPFDNADVRTAIAMGLDRQRITDNYYPEGSEVASHFTPCSIPNGCAGESWYDFDLAAANAMLDAAGFPAGDDGIRFTTAIYYRDVFRSYLPEPGLVAVEIQTQLRDNLGIEAEVIVMESGEFIELSTGGSLEGIHLLGWGADYPHVTNFLDFHFNALNPQFGDAHASIFDNLAAAASISSVAEAASYYEAANNAIKELVPMIPIVHGASADAALATLEGAYVPPFGATQWQFLDSGKDTLVYMQNAEPISLYCADETDGESLRPCQNVVETLLEYGNDSGDTHGELATECVGNADSSVWTCSLREDVTFHDGSHFDANDVVASWAAGIDASDPTHIGNTGGFDYYAYLWGGLMNDE